LAAELEKELGTEARLIKGKDGVFEVEADGRLVFSKRKLGRFPEPGEVVNLIRGL
jgi:selenoprotein W-related protein